MSGRASEEWAAALTFTVMFLVPLAAIALVIWLLVTFLSMPVGSLLMMAALFALGYALGRAS
jgi:hypothetical protein